MLPSNLFLLYCKALPVHCQEIVTFNQKYSPRPGLTFTNGTCTIKVSRKKGLFYNFILQTLGRGQTAAPHHTPREGRIFAASGLVCRRRLPPPSSRGEPLPGLPGRYHRRREVRPAGRAIRVEPWSFYTLHPAYSCGMERFSFPRSGNDLQGGFSYDQS